MKSDEELRQIASRLLPVEKIYFKYDKGWMLDKLSGLSKEEYRRLAVIVMEEKK